MILVMLMYFAILPHELPSDLPKRWESLPTRRVPHAALCQYHLCNTDASGADPSAARREHLQPEVEALASRACPAHAPRMPVYARRQCLNWLSATGDSGANGANSSIIRARRPGREGSLAPWVANTTSTKSAGHQGRQHEERERHLEANGLPRRPS